jgi:hypothetical protein
LLGIVSCFFGSLVGFGGGFITVPALRLTGLYSPQTVAATSLFMVGVNVGVASFALRKQKRINTRMGWAIGLGGIAGSFGGVYALHFVNPTLFDALYGLMLVFIAYNMLKPVQAGDHPDNTLETPHSEAAGRVELGLIGIAVGFVSTLFGIGAGTIAIPLLMWRYKLPAYIAMPTASFIALIYIWPGVLAQISQHRVDWSLGIPLSIGAVIGANLGAKYSQRLKSLQLKRIFGAVCIFAVVALTARHLPVFQSHTAAATILIKKG